MADRVCRPLDPPWRGATPGWDETTEHVRFMNKYGIAIGNGFMSPPLFTGSVIQFHEFVTPRELSRMGYGSAETVQSSPQRRDEVGFRTIAESSGHVR